MGRISLHLLALLLLLSMLQTTTPSVSSELPSDGRQAALLQLRQLFANELARLRHRERSPDESDAGAAAKRADAAATGGATLDDIVAGAKVFATGMAGAVEPVTAPTADFGTTTANFSAVNGTAAAAAGVFTALWFQQLLAHMLAAMPLAAWIAVLTAAGLLLLALVIALCVCCCRLRGGRDRRHRSRGEGAPQSLLYNDLDIVGKKKPPYGIINFSLEYEVPTSQLIITASSCIGLPKDLKEVDPYMVIQVSLDVKPGQKPPTAQLPADPHERSKVVKNCVDPAFNFTRKVKIKDKRHLNSLKITFEIYDWDIGTRHRMIARKVLRLAKLGEKIDDILGRKVEYSRNLHPGVNQEPTGAGDICLALCYSTQERNLWVHVIECKAVFLQKFDQPDLDTLPNTYVKLALSMRGSAKRVSKSTGTVKESRNPYFNQQFVFPMEPNQMPLASLRVTLMHRTETLRMKRTVGSLTLSLEAEKNSLALLHWSEAVSSHGRPMARWHSLVTPEEERRLAGVKAAAELKRQLERAEDDQGIQVAESTSSLVRREE